MISGELQTVHNVSPQAASVFNTSPMLNSDLCQSSNGHSNQSPQYSPVVPITAMPAFEHILSTVSLPPPGPAHYAARRALWLASTSGVPSPPVPSTSRQRLEQLLSMPGAVESEEVWKAGVEKVWKGLVAGGKLKRRLPMNLVIKILHAGWLRDPDTWPPGEVAPEPDDVMDDPPTFHAIPTIPAGYFSGITPPWIAANGTVEDRVEGSAGPRASGMVGAEL